jgi:hypothetical protein
MGSSFFPMHHPPAELCLPSSCTVCVIYMLLSGLICLCGGMLWCVRDREQ